MEIMDKKELGYTQPLFILAFDHRSSFKRGLLGIEKELSKDQEQEIADMKEVVYEGFKAAVNSGGIPKRVAALLVDEQFGEKILEDAKKEGYCFALPVEKSGQKEFEFEYGQDFGDHIEKFKPDFVKALIRYNPEDNDETNLRQREKLKILSDYCHDAGYKFLIEALIPPTEAQLAKTGGDKRRYDSRLRPALAVRVVQELLEAGIEPDVWKIEGMESAEDYRKFIKIARSGGRSQVGVVILGRGADNKQVEKWLAAGKKVKGVLGFAIGRTIFWEALSDLKAEKISRTQAVSQIGEQYYRFYNLFNS